MNSGWIKLHRKFIYHWLYSDNRPFTKREAWYDILLMVNHAEEKVNFGNYLLICEPGESLKSLDTWARRWHWTKSKVKRFFELLQKDNMICIKNEQITTRITVINWMSYQGNCNANETQVKRKRNANETQVKPNNNDIRMIKNDKEEIYSSEQQKNVVSEPIKLDADLVKILNKYQTLNYVCTNESFQFWENILETASYYIPDEDGMRRWFTLHLGNIDTWQRNNPHRASRSRKGLERRISIWLTKEFGKLETLKRTKT